MCLHCLTAEGSLSHLTTPNILNRPIDFSTCNLYIRCHSNNVIVRYHQPKIHPKNKIRHTTYRTSDWLLLSGYPNSIALLKYCYYFQQCNDVALMTYLGTITKGCNAINQLVNRFNVLYDRQGMGRRMRGLFF